MKFKKQLSEVPVSRRAVLGKLGLAVGAAYVAPVMLSLSPARASSSGDSYSAASASSYSAPSSSNGSSQSSYSAPARSGNSSTSSSSFSGGGSSNSRSSFSGPRRNGRNVTEWWLRATGQL